MKENIKREIKSWIGIFLGCIIMASGYVFFINPYNIVPGGVYGASIVLHNLIPDIQPGTFGYMFDIPLLIISVLVLGSRLGAKTIVAALTTPLIMNTMSMLAYPTKEALEALDPTLLLHGRIDMSNDLMLTVVIGSIIIGIGCGMVVKSGATTGGSDIVAMIMQKYLHIRFSNAILMVDGAVVLFGLVVIGLTTDSNAILLSLYSLIAIVLISRVIARTINGAKDDKIVFVISNSDLEHLHTFILRDLDRTATLIKSSGLYTHEDKEMLFLVVSYKEVQRVKTAIREADDKAFVVVTDAYDTYGEGWKQLPKADEMEVE